MLRLYWDFQMLMELHNLKTFINNFRQLLEHDVFLIPSVGIVSVCSMFSDSPF